MQRTCKTCIYYEFYTDICYNTDSDGAAAFNDPEHSSCPFWENAEGE